MDLNAEARDKDQIGKSLNSLREKLWIPCVLYGHETKPISLKVELHEFNKIFKIAGQSTLVDFVVENQSPVKVLIHDIQYHPTTDKIIHIDFYKVNMNEKIKTEIPVEIVGESKAVKELEGSLLVNLNEIEIECLPADLIQEIKVDITPLETFEDKILVSDLKVPNTVTIINDKEEVVALVNPPRSEEELAELDEVVEENVEDVEVTGEKPAEEAEGETPAEGTEAPTEQPAETPKTEENTEK